MGCPRVGRALALHAADQRFDSWHLLWSSKHCKEQLLSAGLVVTLESCQVGASKKIFFKGFHLLCTKR